MTLAGAAAAVLLFTFQDARIDESSGLASTPSGGWLWTANDSGNVAQLFAVDERGRTLAVASLPDTRLVDVEDLALGPDRTLYLADIGDNRARRASVSVLRVPEPTIVPGRTGGRLTTAAPLRTVLTYEDGPHDAETLLVSPRTGQVLVVTKSVLGSAVYAAPVPLADGVLRRVGSIALRATGTTGGPAPGFLAQLLATGGAVSADGRRLVVRTYTDAYVWDVPGDDLVAALRVPPRVLPLPATAQGEAITWTGDGAALLTSSEGRRAPVWQVPAPPPTTTAAPTSTSTSTPTSIPAPATPIPAPATPLATPPTAVPSPPDSAAPAGSGHGRRGPLLLAGGLLALLAAAGATVRAHRTGHR